MKVENFEKKEYQRRKIILETIGISYADFLLSDTWKKSRESAFKRFGRKCFICGGDKSLNVHHNNYNERNLNGSVRCLVVLCQPCHYEVHRISKEKGWYYKKTVRSLKNKFKKYGDIHFKPTRTQWIYKKKFSTVDKK